MVDKSSDRITLMPLLNSPVARADAFPALVLMPEHPLCIWTLPSGGLSERVGNAERRMGLGQAYPQLLTPVWKTAAPTAYLVI
jgi:hypothetical protein